MKDCARDYGFGDPRNPTRALVEIMFGSPAAGQHEAIVYDLILWPEHEFRWGLEVNGDANHDGFALESARLPSWVPRDPEVLRRTFEPWHHTGHEVRALVGEPDLDLSWGAAWAWHYSHAEGSWDIVFDFDYGLLREVRIEAPAPRDLM